MIRLFSGSARFRVSMLVLFSAVFMLYGCPLPAAEYYVSDSAGDDQNSGTIEKPFKTLSTAAGKLQPGDTVFMREGTYRESVKIKVVATAENPVLITNYDNEKVAMKGSDTFTAADFSQVDMPGYDSENEYNKGKTKLKLLKKESFPVNPSMVFLNGKPLTQIGDDVVSVALDGNWTRNSTGSEIRHMRSNSFYYDKNDNSLYLRIAGNGKESDLIEIPTRQCVLDTSGSEYITIRGLEFMHSSALGNQYGGNLVAIRSHCLLEDCTVCWSAGGGVSLGGNNAGVINCELSFNGNVGVGANKAVDFLVKNCRVHHNNYRDYNPNWHTGGMKFIPDTNGTIEDCKVYENYGYGIWFDFNQSGRPIVVKNNAIMNNIGGIYLEVITNAVIENNFIARNKVFGFQARGDFVSVIGNSFIENGGYCSVGFVTDGRRKQNHDNKILNNYFLNNKTEVELHFLKDDESNNSFNNICDNNTYVRESYSTLRLTSGTTGEKSLQNIFQGKDFEKWQEISGYDKNSIFLTGIVTPAAP